MSYTKLLIVNNTNICVQKEMAGGGGGAAYFSRRKWKTLGQQVETTTNSTVHRRSVVDLGGSVGALSHRRTHAQRSRSSTAARHNSPAPS